MELGTWGRGEELPTGYARFPPSELQTTPSPPPRSRRPAAVLASSSVILPLLRFNNIRYHNRRPRFLQDSLHFCPLPPFRRPSPTLRPSPPAACASGWRDGAAPALRPHRLNMPAAVTPLPSPRPGSPLVSAAGGRSGSPTPSQAEALPFDLPSLDPVPGGVVQTGILLFTTVRGTNARARVRASRWSSLSLCHFNGCCCRFSLGVGVPCTPSTLRGASGASCGVSVLPAYF